MSEKGKSNQIDPTLILHLVADRVHTNLCVQYTYSDMENLPEIYML